MSRDKVNMKKFAQGYKKPVNWWRSMAMGSMFLIVIAIAFSIVFTVYNMFGKKTMSNDIDLSGSKDAKVTIIQKDKRTLIPFIEAGVEQRSNSDMGTYIRGGLRFEF